MFTEINKHLALQSAFSETTEMYVALTPISFRGLAHCNKVRCHPAQQRAALMGFQSFWGEAGVWAVAAQKIVHSLLVVGVFVDNEKTLPPRSLSVQSSCNLSVSRYRSIKSLF